MIELEIIKALCSNKEAYSLYYKYIDLSYIKQNFPVLSKIVNLINLVYSRHTTKQSISREELEASFLESYPVLKDTDRRELSGLLDRIFTSASDEAIITDLLQSHRARGMASEIAKLALEVHDGKKPVEALIEAVEELNDIDVGSGIEFVTDDLDELYSKTIAGPGIKWPLDCLNRSLGPLRKGNFGFVFARPEGGKTTFVSHVATHAATQVDSKIIWFNNEQPGEEVQIRLYQSAFGITTKALFSDRDKWKQLYKESRKGLLKIVDDATIDKRTIELVCEEHQPSLVIFDQIDKIHGFSDDRYDLELGKRYQWARELSKEYCPIIGVTQADASGENVKYLTMANVANAKTAKQAEADWILGIGSSQSDDFGLYRYFNISKNKLLGDEDSDPSERHAAYQVIIEPEIGRYKEL